MFGSSVAAFNPRFFASEVQPEGFAELYAQPIATVIAALIALGAATIAWRGVKATIAANAANIQRQLDAQRQLEDERIHRGFERDKAALRVETYEVITSSMTSVLRVSVGYFVVGSVIMTVLNLAFGVVRRPLYRLTALEIRLERAGMDTELEALRGFIRVARDTVHPPFIVSMLGLFPPQSWVLGAYHIYKRDRLGEAAHKAAKAVLPVCQ